MPKIRKNNGWCPTCGCGATQTSDETIAEDGFEVCYWCGHLWVSSKDGEEIFETRLKFDEVLPMLCPDHDRQPHPMSGIFQFNCACYRVMDEAARRKTESLHSFKAFEWDHFRVKEEWDDIEDEEE